MKLQRLRLLRILCNPRITATPLRVLRELRRRGKQRLPDTVQGELEGSLNRPQTMQFIRSWLDGERLSRHRGKWVLNSFLPPFPSHAFNRMFENLLSGRRLSPVSAYLAVTAECPYHCWHCSLKNRGDGHLASSHWLGTISQLNALGTSIIGITGGEPLMRDDLPQLVQEASDGGAATILYTSGAGFDSDAARRLRRAGLWALCVSLDHTDAAEHDRLRGHEGAFEQALRTIALARKAGFYTMVGMVATPEIVDSGEHERIYELARQHGVQEVRIVEPMPCGRLTGAAPEQLLAPEQVRRIREFHVRTNRRGKLPKVCAFNQVESPENFGCGAGTQHLFIDPSGEVCPCDFTPMSFGNVTQYGLEEIWNRMSTAMGAPRRHCFAQKHSALIGSFAEQGFPLPPETSEQVARKAGPEPLPDYFAVVTGECPGRQPSRPG